MHTTVLGIGERSGNAPMEEIVMALKTMYGDDVGIDTSVYRICDLWASKPRRSRRSRAFERRLLVALGLVALADVTPYANWGLVLAELGKVGAGNISGIAEKHFAFALSSGIIQIALALAFALFVAHVLFLRAALCAAKRELGRTQDLRGFAAKFDTISEKLRRNAVVGHAWHEFAGTTVRGDDAVRNTVRPQLFINLADARERLFGLKMTGSIPSFFVGLGLLLTFIGLVFALNSAAGSTGAGSAEKMTA